MSDETAQPKRRWPGILKRIPLIIGAVVVIAAGFYFGMIYWAGTPGPATEDQTIVIERGETLTSLSRRLTEAGIVDNAARFRFWARMTEQDRDIKAGEYRLEAGLSPQDLLDRLVEGDVEVYRLTVPEGLTSYEIVELLLDDSRLTGTLDKVPPEGSLLPETYQFQRGDTRRDIIERMAAAHETLVDRLWEERDPDLPFATKQEAVTLASIVEKETGLRDERKRVAGVFINRLNRGMQLQADPTVIYGLTGGTGRLGRRLTRADWRVDHPYNTYIIPGLPPGPIANAGSAALEAVFDPEDHNYLFFVTDGQGGHRFAVTYDQHRKNIAQRDRDRAQQAN